MAEGYVGDGETLPTTPDEALELISGFVDDPEDTRLDLEKAFDILYEFIKTWSGHVCEPELEWGEPGDCLDRLENDTDYEDDKEFVRLRDAIYALDKWGHSKTHTASRANYDALIAYAKDKGYGEHYGDPHCIWCLQGD